MLKVHKAAEKFWLGIVVMAVALSIYFLWCDGMESKQYLVLPAVAFSWYLFRRSFRKRLEKQINEGSQES
tara:strand:+ start:379 stop:588 length:210 start_codon:yes stop_codon:yes gene_type:complete